MEEPTISQPHGRASLADFAGLTLASLIVGPLCAVLGGVIGGVEYSVYLVLLLGPAGLLLGPLGLLVGFGVAQRVRDMALRGFLALAFAGGISLALPALLFGFKNWPQQVSHRFTLWRAASDEAYLRDIIGRYGVKVSQAEAIALGIAREKRNGIPADLVPALLGKTLGQSAGTVATIIRMQTVPEPQLWEAFRRHSDDKWDNRYVWEALVEKKETPELLLVELSKVNEPSVAERARQRLQALSSRR